MASTGTDWSLDVANVNITMWGDDRTLMRISSEFAWLVAIVGGAIVLAARTSLRKGRSTTTPQSAPENRTMTWAMLAYGAGIAIFGAVAGVTQGEDDGTDLVLAGWLVGGIVVLGIVDFLLSMGAKTDREGSKQ
jgi:hypothetical protein